MNLFQASSSILKYGLLPLLAGVIAACSSSQYAPVQDLGYSVQRLAPIAKAAPKSYQVKPGDTMFAIAWRFDWDYKELARVNGIKSPYTIYVGQAIYFDKALIKQIADAKGADKSTTSKVPASALAVTKPKPKKQVVASKPILEKAFQGPDSVVWSWPLNGKVLQSFSTKGGGFNGIDLASPIGSSVKAASGGIIVYAGAGIQGYGKLIVVKHNESYLSAYAYNSNILVDEGQVVEAGQVIALVGKGPQLDPRLHFEIRKNGKPVNPLGYLPKN
jgi:lipoprotein NlpD